MDYKSQNSISSSSLLIPPLEGAEEHFMWLALTIPVVNHYQSTTAFSYFLKYKSLGQGDSACSKSQSISEDKIIFK